MRIWVTGIGVVSPLARGASLTMDRLLAGERSIRPLTLFAAQGCRSDLAAEVPGISIEEFAPSGEASGWSRTDVMAVLAAREALDQGQLDVHEVPVDLVFGGTVAGMFETEAILGEMVEHPDALRPREQMLSHPLSATVDRLRQCLGPFGTARTICSACSSGNNALLLAGCWLRTGRSERVLVGGADALCRLTYAGFSALGALSSEPCRPFDAARSGLSLGEGAAFLLLETEVSARARGRSPIAELRGWAVGAEAHHITNPQPSGEMAARVMSEAIAGAELEPSSIDYVNAHGTATPLNDLMEAKALERCLGGECSRVWVSSTKGHFGHTLGAAGALEAAITAMVVARGQLPPTAGLEQIDPACAQLRHAQTAVRADVRAAMSSSFGFGGSDTAVVFAQPELFPPVARQFPRRVGVMAAATVGPLGLLGTAESARYLGKAALPPAATVPFEPKEHLQLARARRLDRVARLASAVGQTALAECGGDQAADFSFRTGLILASAYGSVDNCADYVARFLAKGFKFASPATFPNLLPSSPAAHASVYLGLCGPVFASFDLAATAVGSMVTAVELLEAGQAKSMVAGGVEECSGIVEQVLSPLHGARASAGARREGAAVLLFAALGSDGELSSGQRVVADVAQALSWRGETPPERVNWPAAEEFADEVAVFTAHDDERSRRCLASWQWSGVPIHAFAPRVGYHECAGGFAAAAAVAALAAGERQTALVLSVAADRGYALLMTRRAKA